MAATSFETIFTRLSSSKFRARFHLTKEMRAYVEQKGLPVIKQHAEDLISKRLALAHITNDGKQTPMKGHPVFIAQHACAACCRGCLEKWYGIPKNQKLTIQEQAAIVAVLMAWIERELVQ